MNVSVCVCVDFSWVFGVGYFGVREAGVARCDSARHYVKEHERKIRNRDPKFQKR